MRVSAKQGRSVAEVLAAFDRFAVLGYTVIGRDLFPDDLQPVEHDALLLVENLAAPLTALHLMSWAGRHDLSVPEVRRRLARLADAGFVVLPEQLSDDEAVPEESDLEILRQEAFRYDSRVEEQRLEHEFAALSYIVWRIFGAGQGNVAERVEKHKVLLRYADIGRSITVPELLHLAFFTDRSVEQTISLYRRLLPHSADLSQLPESAHSSDVKILDWHTYGALVNYVRLYTGPDRTLGWALSPFDIARSAAYGRTSIPSYLDRLEPYRALGAPIPELPSNARELLSSHTVDKYDAAMLADEDEVGIKVPIDRVTPLRLVRTAGRFGWTLAATHERFARFTDIGLELQIDAVACDGDIVYWQDLLVVTTHLDGQEPVLSGVVGSAQLTAAADEIGETVTAVHRRLTRYAPLFGFTLEPLPSDS